MRQEGFQVVCEACSLLIGSVREVEIDSEKRPGFFKNVCTPSPMPTKCPQCKGFLTRTNSA